MMAVDAEEEAAGRDEAAGPWLVGLFPKAVLHQTKARGCVNAATLFHSFRMRPDHAVFFT
jgi:hypothetical protein